MGDAEYAYAWDHLLLPLVRAWRPQAVLVSAGFDAAAGDPLGEGKGLGLVASSSPTPTPAPNP